MTRSQFAKVVRADEKWVENTARVLGRQLAYSPTEARWFGLVRLLAHEFGVPLVRAARLATEAVRQPADLAAFAVDTSADGSATIVLDLARYHSGFAAAVATALHQGGPRRPGRPPLRASGTQRSDPLGVATRYGVDLGLLRESRRRRPAERLARLDANAAFLRALRPVTPGARRARVPLVSLITDARHPAGI